MSADTDKNTARTVATTDHGKLDVQALVLLAVLLAAGFILNFTVGNAVSTMTGGFIQPEFIIADEPISALDVSIRAQVLNLLSHLQRKKGLTYLFIAHDLSVMRFICDRIAVIHKGQIVELSETELLFANPLHPYTQALLSAVPMPNPTYEKKKQPIAYDESVHDYSVDKPVWQEIEPGHFVLANQQERDRYMERLAACAIPERV